MEDAETQEIITTRIVDASQQHVWKAWTDPAQVGLWWGPAGFTNSIETMDVRPGGVWKYVMHGPDGVDYPNTQTFDEVDPPSRITYLHHASKEFGLGEWRMVCTFEAIGDRTSVTVRAVFTSAEDFRKHVDDFHAKEGAEQMLERLDAFVTGSQ